MKNINNTLIRMTKAQISKFGGTIEGCKKVLADCKFCYNDLSVSQKRNSYGKYLKDAIVRLNDKIFKFENPALYKSYNNAIKEFIENTHIF